MTNEQRNAVTQNMLDSWKHMTNDEQEQLCCTTGTITLFEDAITKLNIPSDEATQEDCDYCMQEFDKYAWEDDNHSIGINNYDERLKEACHAVGIASTDSMSFSLWCILQKLCETDTEVSICYGIISIKITKNSIDIFNNTTDESIITFNVR